MRCSVCRKFKFLFLEDFSKRQRKKRPGQKRMCIDCTPVGGWKSDYQVSYPFVISTPTNPKKSSSIVFGKGLLTDVGKTITTVTLWFLIRRLSYIKQKNNECLVDHIEMTLDVMINAVWPCCDYQKRTSPFVFEKACRKVINLAQLEEIGWSVSSVNPLERCAEHTCPCKKKHHQAPDKDLCGHCSETVCTGIFCADSCNCPYLSM